MNTSSQSSLYHSVRHVRAVWILQLLLALPAVAHAQFNYIITNGTVTITGYAGPGGAVTIPNTIAGLPVTGIGDSAFYLHGNVASIVTPNSITNIGNSAFCQCSNLANLMLGGGVITIGDAAFQTCTKLGVVAIPNSVVRIGNQAFNGCASLMSIEIGTGVTSIGFAAFSGCTSLSSATVPDNVVSLGDSLFAGCTSLCCVSLGSSVTNIPSQMCSRCTYLNSVTIGSSVTSIGNWAFDSCTSLSTLTIPNSITTIGYAVFSLTKLTNITIPSNTATIARGAFEYSYSLAAITVDALNPVYTSVDGVLFNKKQTALFAWPPAKAGVCTIPLGVTVIGDGAFRNCPLLSSVTIPNTVVTIGDDAFYWCTGLSSATIGSGVTRFGSFAFYHCTSLGTLTIPGSVTNLGDYTFRECTSLSSVTIPNSVASIGYQTFFSCSGLNQIAIPDSVTSIGGDAFWNCNNLTSVTLGNCITNIGSYAFGYCTSLANLNIPNSVTSIGEGAFFKCSSLVSMVIPEGITQIGGGTFSGCNSLTSITIPMSVTTIADLAFPNCTSLTRVYFKGNAPILGGSSVFSGDTNAIVYYLPGTIGWDSTFGGRPTALWLPPLSPQSQTAETGSAVSIRATVGADPAVGCQWFFDGATRLTPTDPVLHLTNVQLSHAGTYTAVVTNATGSVTSAPVILSVIPRVERRRLPGLILTGVPGTSLNLEFTPTLGPGSPWAILETVPLSTVPKWYFDVTTRHSPRRFYRAWQSGLGPPPMFELHFVPAISLIGTVGDTIRVDAINQFGPTNAWFTLDTVTLTNSSQLYFDTSAIGQPARLYRLVQMP